MTLLYAASEQESFISVGIVGWDDTGTFHDSAMSQGAMKLGNTDTLNATFTATSDLWVHWHAYLRFANANAGTPFVLSSGGTGLVRIHVFSDAEEGLDFEYWNGSSWISIELNALTENVLQDVDLHCNFAASGGEFTLYQNSVQVSQFTGDTTVGASNADNITFSGAAIGGIDCYLSQVVVKTTSTLNNQLETLSIDGNGVRTDFTGSFTDIDDVGLNEDGTLVTGAANGDEGSYTITSSTTPANNALSALIIATRSSRGTTGPQNLQITSVVSGISFPSASVSGLDLSLRPYQSILTINPHTGLAWDDATIVGTEIGLKAIT